ncbi:hypothetical protein GGI64_005683 [Rhizobium leguminosarum]|uniref:Uncharacterized protein n=1 Tax=Rhizobium leguminosarum TaxID=384 RepID=A0A7Z0E4Q8_RHILE|nr:hypothetical protein [Rhizobium leguminosarum]NYJ14590.1 hypothetical protein [Rhizobium leguminosarum]
MSKTNVRELQKRAEQQVKNTSAGGHLGGTYFGQQPDGKTASDSSNDSAKARPNDGAIERRVPPAYVVDILTNCCRETHVSFLISVLGLGPKDRDEALG